MRGITIQRISLGWLMIIGAFGAFFGLGIFTFTFAEGGSYLSDDPEACVNCHVMREQFDNWNRSSHKAVATCNDCHTPHTFPEKWLVKGLNGWNHSLAFTTGNFPDNLQIKEFNAQVAQENCVECHETLTFNIHRSEEETDIPCVACHNDVGH